MTQSLRNNSVWTWTFSKLEILESCGTFSVNPSALLLGTGFFIFFFFSLKNLGGGGGGGGRLMAIRIWLKTTNYLLLSYSSVEIKTWRHAADEIIKFPVQRHKYIYVLELNLTSWWKSLRHRDRICFTDSKSYNGYLLESVSAFLQTLDILRQIISFLSLCFVLSGSGGGGLRSGEKNTICTLLKTMNEMNAS